MTDTSWHPTLQKLAAAHNRMTRQLGLTVVLGMATVLIVMMTIALHYRDLVYLLIFATAALVLLPTLALLGWLLWYLQRQMMEQLREANSFLRDGHPVPVRLLVTGRAGRRGALIAAQRPVTSPQSVIADFIWIQSSMGTTGRLPNQEFTAQLYFQDARPNGRLVMLHEGQAWLGRWIDRQQYNRRRRRGLLLALLGGLLLTLVLLLIIVR